MSGAPMEQKAKADTGLKDFRNFLYLCWRQLGLGEPTRIQYQMAQYLQKGPDRLMIQAFRGVGKSWVCSAFALWWLYHHPNDNVVVVSATKERSDAFTTFCLRLINESPFLRHMKPREGQRQSMVGFDVGNQTMPSHTQSLVAAGVGGQITGKRANLIIVDDVEIPGNSETATLREKLAARVLEFEALIRPDTPGRVVYLGTPQTEDTIYKSLPERGYEIRIWPIIYPDQALERAYAGRLAPELAEAIEKDQSIRGRATEPVRFSDEWIAVQRVRMGEAFFRLQMLLDPRMADEDLYPLRLRDLMVWDLAGDTVPEKLIWSSSPEMRVQDLPMVGLTGDHWIRAVVLDKTHHIPYQGTIMSVDPAGRGKDETAIAVVSSCNGLLFLRCVKGLKGYGEDVMSEIARVAQRFKVNKILVESNFGDGMFVSLLRPALVRVYPVAVEEVKHSTQKEKRIIDTLEPLFSGHRLVVDHDLIRDDYRSTGGLAVEDQHRYRLWYQATRITREKGCLRSDDRLDALAIACAYWVQAVAQDVEQAAKRTQQARLDQMLNDFIKQAGGRGRGPRSIISVPLG